MWKIEDLNEYQQKGQSFLIKQVDGFYLIAPGAQKNTTYQNQGTKKI
jgi:hypothetical protein